MCKTVPFQIFNSNAKNNSFQLVRTAFPSLFFFSFFQGARGAIIGFTAPAFQTDATIRLAIFFKELLKNISEIYLQGRLTAKAQTVCLEVLRARSPSLHFKIPPPPSPARVIRGSYTGAVQSYLTFSIKLLTFF